VSDVIRTLRLDLTSVTEEDFECVRQLRTDVKVREYLGGPATDEKIRAAFSVMMESGALPRWIVRSRPDCRFIGLVALGHHCDGCDVEVSYELLPDSWGKGYATEAVRAVLGHALTELALPRVIAETQTANAPSRRLLERLGMSLERTVERFGAEQAIYTTT
jgi:ribosomal-protein-alanine N-acetyltransferase